MGLLFTAPEVWGTPFYWERMDVTIELEPDGDMQVRETQVYRFTEEHTNQRYRWIPLDKVAAIEDIEVYHEGKPIPSTTGVENNRLWIRWRHPLNPPATHEFTLKYRVVGGVQTRSGEDSVY